MIMKNNNENKILNVPNLRFPEFSGEWENCQIANILSIGSGRDYKHLEKGNIPVFGTGGYMTSVNECIYDGETTFIGRKGSINKPFYYNGKFWTVDTLFYTHSFNKTTPKFVYCLFQTINWLRYNEASGVPSLSKDTIEKIKVFIPQLDEQRKISEMLSVIDERIATQNKIIEDLKKLKSAIRKKIFSLLKDEYTKSFEINQLLDYEQPTAYIVANDEYSTDTRLTPVLTANKGFILGYTDEKNGIYQKGACIIFDDFTMDAKYVSFPFKVKSSAIKILTAKPNVNLRFMFEYLSHWELKSEEHKRHYISEISPLVIELPSKEKQNIIALLMTSLNNKLTIEEKAKIRYEVQKGYLLSQMFI